MVGQRLQNTQINNRGIKGNYSTMMPHELLHTSCIFSRINNKKRRQFGNLKFNSILF